MLLSRGGRGLQAQPHHPRRSLAPLRVGNDKEYCGWNYVPVICFTLLLNRCAPTPTSVICLGQLQLQLEFIIHRGGPPGQVENRCIIMSSS